MRLTNKAIIEKLQIFRRITPGRGFADNSRRMILEPRPALAPTGVLAGVSRSLSFVFETALVAVLFLVVILGGVFGLSKSLFLPPLQGINEEALVSEADAINKDISLQLNEIAYFGNHKTSTDRVVALGERKPSAKEQLPLTETSTDQEIDKLLNQVINEY